MRLVDAEKCPCNECNMFCDKNCCDKFIAWLKGCDYDVDSVVTQLNEFRNSVYEIFKLSDSTNANSLASKAIAKTGALETAIETVKDPNNEERTKRILASYKEIIDDLQREIREDQYDYTE